MTKPKSLTTQYKDIAYIISEHKELLVESERETKKQKRILSELHFMRGELAPKIFDEVFNHD